ncbi:MAG: hypothetical protein RLY16_786 [Bacteroidota bacterium]
MSIQTIAVVGAGTMGAGIAQVAASSGYTTILFDVQPQILEKAKASILQNFDFLVSKQKLTVEAAHAAMQRLTFIQDITACKADLIIEAIVEKTEVKQQVFHQLAAINGPATILASNTSSLSISKIQETIPQPERFLGMHFFNPAPIMKLVEVIKGAQTHPAIAEQLMQLCKQMGKVPVLCTDAPGFIVNRVARHYYLEAMQLVEKEGVAISAIDQAMEAAGFKMGPFKLMDLIGMDINYAVSESIYHAFGNHERFKPSPIQQQKVAEGKLGRKTGEGFYKYNN